MILHDAEELIPNHDILRQVIAKHPLDQMLMTHIRSITVYRSERYGIAQEQINIDSNNDVTLGVGQATSQRRNYIFILYHEFSHIADRLRPAFQYSAQLKETLSSSERICLMEIWNEYINSRLNAFNLYEPAGTNCCGTLNGRLLTFPPNTEGELMAHMSTLEREGFLHAEAKKLVEMVWKSPEMQITYPDMIRTVKEGRDVQRRTK